MANPPGMKTVHLEVSETEAIHVYSDADEIWLQLRRNVPSDKDLGATSFKSALAIKPKHAHELGLMLLNMAQDIYKKRKAEQLSGKEKKQPKKATANGGIAVLKA